jgi:hypothetical protein
MPRQPSRMHSGGFENTRSAHVKVARDACAFPRVPARPAPDPDLLPAHQRNTPHVFAWLGSIEAARMACSNHAHRPCPRAFPAARPAARALPEHPAAALPAGRSLHGNARSKEVVCIIRTQPATLPRVISAAGPASRVPRRPQHRRRPRRLLNTRVRVFKRAGLGRSSGASYVGARASPPARYPGRARRRTPSPPPISPPALRAAGHIRKRRSTPPERCPSRASARVSG